MPHHFLLGIFVFLQTFKQSQMRQVYKTLSNVFVDAHIYPTPTKMYSGESLHTWGLKGVDLLGYW